MLWWIHKEFVKLKRNYIWIKVSLLVLGINIWFSGQVVDMLKRTLLSCQENFSWTKLSKYLFNNIYSHQNFVDARFFTKSVRKKCNNFIFLSKFLAYKKYFLPFFKKTFYLSAMLYEFQKLQNNIYLTENMSKTIGFVFFSCHSMIKFMFS